jgi:histone-lysine N-methyltransferase SETD3
MGKRRNKASRKDKEEAPESKISAEEGTVDFFKQKGNVHFAAKEYQQAIDFYTQAIEKAQEEQTEGVDLARIHSNRSASYYELGEEFASACLEDALACVELDPSWPKAHFRKGKALALVGEYEQAEEAFQVGIAIEPQNSDLERALASIEERLVQLRIDREVEEETSGNDVFSQFLVWLREGGAVFPDMYLRKYTENYRGVHMSRRVAGNRQILYVPKHFLITVEMGKETAIGRKIIEADLDLSAMKHCFLCVFALVDRQNEESFYQPYYRILPQSFDNMPIFWTDEELELLTGSYMLKQVHDRRKNIQADYEDICRAAPEFTRFTLEEFTWARMMVASRNFGVEIDGIKTDALVPYADMLNHLRPRQTRWTYDQSQDGFTISSLHELRAGDQVFDSYGKKCNSRFLLNYGFAVDDNRDPDGHCHNQVRLYFDLLADDPALSIKQSLLVSEFSGRGIRVSMNYSDTSTREAFSFMRFACAKGNEVMLLPRVDSAFDWDDSPIPPLSKDTEIDVLQLLRQFCEDQLLKYPTTLEEDNAMLESGELEMFSNERNARVLVRSEKEVCHFWIHAAEVAIPLLQQEEWKDIKKIMNRDFRVKDALAKYLTAVISPLFKGGNKRK